jgi:RNA polymerase sigma-70 factor (ECF subfamily)
MDQVDDQRAISAVLDGDINAYAVIVERYQRPINNLMCRMTGCRADAADLTQETFIRAYERLHLFKEGKRFFPWLYTIGLNLAKNRLQQGKVVMTSTLEDWEPGSGLDYAAQQEENLCAEMDFPKLYEALNELPLDYREAIILRYREDMPLEDIAAAIRISLSGAKMRVYRGLEKLRDLLKKNGYER